MEGTIKDESLPVYIIMEGFILEVNGLKVSKVE